MRTAAPEYVPYASAREPTHSQPPGRAAREKTEARADQICEFYCRKGYCNYVSPKGQEKRGCRYEHPPNDIIQAARKRVRSRQGPDDMARAVEVILAENARAETSRAEAGVQREEAR